MMGERDQKIKFAVQNSARTAIKLFRSARRERRNLTLRRFVAQQVAQDKITQQELVALSASGIEIQAVINNELENYALRKEYYSQWADERSK